jgi:RNA polymerase sigma factor (sigma-70 family)
MMSADQPANGEMPTIEMHQLVERHQGGDTEATNELLRRIGTRMQAIARRMLRRFPGVERWEQTGDVVGLASVRLLNALKEIKPDTTRAFFGLAAEQVRRVLIDLARHYYGPHGWGANVESQHNLIDEEGRPALGREPIAPSEPMEELERWTGFHEAVAQLPAEEREVFSLRFYHGWGQKEIGELIHKDERTVRRKWRSACLHLDELLKGKLPPGAEDI